MDCPRDIPTPPTDDPLDALLPEQRLAISAALTAAFTAELADLAREGRARLAAQDAQESSSELQGEAATDAAA